MRELAPAHDRPQKDRRRPVVDAQVDPHVLQLILNNQLDLLSQGVPGGRHDGHLRALPVAVTQNAVRAGRGTGLCPQGLCPGGGILVLLGVWVVARGGRGGSQGGPPGGRPPGQESSAITPRSMAWAMAWRPRRSRSHSLSRLKS